MVLGCLILASCGRDKRPSEPAESPAPRPAATLPAPVATSPVTAPTVPPTSDIEPNVSFRFDRLVSRVDRTLVQAGITLADEYLQRIGFGLPPATVYAYMELNNISADWEALSEETGIGETELSQRFGRYVGLAFPSAVFIFTGAQPWQEMPAAQQIRLVAHEYFHLAQFHLVGRAPARAFFAGEIGRQSVLGPNWLLEGSAEYFSWRVLQDAKLLSLDDYVSRLDMREDVDPADLETYLDFYEAGQSSYDASLRAVAFLIRSNDEQDLMRYYFEMGQGKPWPDAFRSSFGQSIESFYKTYGQYIASR